MKGLYLLSVFFFIAVSLGLNNRPIIGILTQPDSELGTYIAASYVKYIEVCSIASDLISFLKRVVAVV